MVLLAILDTNDPLLQKCLGRHVRHFDHDQEGELGVLLQCKRAIFSQNEKMHLALAHIGDQRLAEASPNGNL